MICFYKILTDLFSQRERGGEREKTQKYRQLLTFGESEGKVSRNSLGYFYNFFISMIFFKSNILKTDTFFSTPGK